MKHYFYILFAVVVLAGCGKDKKETDNIDIDTTEDAVPLTFETAQYKKTTSLPCKERCPKVSIEVPVASGPQPAADNINKKVFNTVREIIYFGEEPYDASDYDDLMNSFIKSYEELKKEWPDEALGWEGTVKATVDYRTDSIMNIKLKNYTYTGGAHGYEGLRSLIFDPATGTTLERGKIFSDIKGFTDYAEKHFREKYKINSMASINSSGFIFENDTFMLPHAIFFKEDGLLLYYNTYEISSYAEGPKELLLPYKDINQYLGRK